MLEEYEYTDYKKYVHFEEGNYKRNFIAKWDLFDVIVICWKQWWKTPVHGHPNKWCYVKILEGNIDETLYNKDNQILKQQNLETGDVLYSHDSIWLHRLENSNKNDVVSLHIYAPGNYNPGYTDNLK
jgi:cysteine dioxygenase